jgi:hypothetical protein
VGGSGVAFRAQQPTTPVIGYLGGGPPEAEKLGPFCETAGLGGAAAWHIDDSDQNQNRRKGCSSVRELPVDRQQRSLESITEPLSLN